MTGRLIVRGIVASRPRHLVTAQGCGMTSFRLLAGADSRERSWFTVIAEGSLAVDAAASLAAGDRVIVVGRLVVREWAGDQPEESGRGSTAEVEAETIGHDLERGRAAFSRVRASPDASPAKAR
jgi:single-strand DNA-binding protein